MARLSDANVAVGQERSSAATRKARSATIPLLHLAQEQDGYVTNDAIRHIAELVGATSAEVLGTCTFYEMFKMEPVGKYLVNICGTMSCALLGAEELMHHAEHKLGIKAGCHHCRRPVHPRARRVPGGVHRGPVPAGELPLPVPGHAGRARQLLDDLAAGRLDDEIPPHGTVARVRQHIPADRHVGPHPPEDGHHRRRSGSPVTKGASIMSGATYSVRPASSPATARGSSRRASSTRIPTRSSATSRPAATRG